MKPRELIFAVVGAFLLALGAWMNSRSTVLRSDVLLGGTCHTLETVLQSKNVRPRGTAVVFHGLSANRRVMLWMGEQMARDGLRVILIDLPGHGDSTDHFSFARTEQCANEAVELLNRRSEIQPNKTILVGHSMGAAVAIRLADRFPTVATIAISPAPLVLPRRMPANLLVFSAQFDLPRLKHEAEELERAAAGQRTAPADFQQLRAFELVRTHLANHTSLLLDRRVAKRVGEWINAALPPRTSEAATAAARMGTQERDVSSTPFPQFGSFLGLCGLLLLFPLAASSTALACGCGRIPQESDAAAHSHSLARGAAAPLAHSQVIWRWMVASLLGVCVLNYVVPLRPLHLYAGDYLASLLLLVGIFLWLLVRPAAAASLDFSPRALAMAAVVGMIVILAFGAWLNWQVTNAWPNAPRWLRFVFLVPILWPYFYVEEILLGPPPEIAQHGRRAMRVAMCLLLRLILWLACIFALYTFPHGEILILLLVTYLAIISFFQRLSCDSVHRHTGSATAAALFGAILAAWFFASVFPIT